MAKEKAPRLLTEQEARDRWDRERQQYLRIILALIRMGIPDEDKDEFDRLANDAGIAPE